MRFQFPPRVYIEELTRENLKIPRFGKILSRRDFSTEKFMIIKNELRKQQNQKQNSW